MKKNITTLLLFMAFGFFLTACGTGNGTTPTPQVSVSPAGIIAEGRLMPAENLDLYFSARGKVAEILVEEGDTVQTGEVLARLAESAQAEAGLTAANLELTSAQQAYNTLLRYADPARAQALQAYINAQTARADAERVWDDLDRDALKNRIDDSQAEVNSKKDILKDAQEEFDRYKELGEDNASRKAAKSALDTSQNNYNEAVRIHDALEGL